MRYLKRESKTQKAEHVMKKIENKGFNNSFSALSALLTTVPWPRCMHGPPYCELS